MKKILPAVLILLLILQSCRKNNVTRDQPGNPETDNNSGAIETSTGLDLAETGDTAVFRMINNADLSTGIPNYTNNNGDTITLGTYEGSSYQKWVITNTGKGYYTIKNQGSGKNLQANHSKDKYELIQGLASNTDEQLWELVSLTGKSYKAINKASGLAITANGNGRIILAPYTNASSQIWGYDRLPADELTATTFSVSKLLQKNMVVQRDRPFTVWGKATENCTVTVKASWNAGLFSVKADASGNWELRIPASPANTTGQTLVCSVNGMQPVKLSNLLIGDVWICSGQSNMTMPVAKVEDPAKAYMGFNGVKDYQAVVASATQSTIRVFTAFPIRLNEPLDDLPYSAQWVVCSPSTAGDFSAIGYFFAKHIDSALRVPVGIIVAGVAGVPCQDFTPKQAIESSPILKTYYQGRSNPASVYNGIIHPLRRLSIKGFLWEHGEANRADQPASNYTLLNAALLRGWRDAFGQGPLPFYFVERPPLSLGEPQTTSDYAYFREAQGNLREIEVNTGMAITTDIPEINNAHYSLKDLVALRLARLALHGTYGISSVNPAGPVYQSFTQTGNTVTIAFSHAKGLKSKGPINQVFFVAGDERKLYRATAAIKGETIVLTVPSEVTTVRAVRYAFTNYAVTNIYNSDDMPMDAFRTDK